MASLTSYVSQVFQTPVLYAAGFVGGIIFVLLVIDYVRSIFNRKGFSNG